MARESVHDLVQDLLNETHQDSSYGRWWVSRSSDSDTPTDSEIPDAFTELLQFLLMEVSTLEAVALRLASEVDALRSA